MSRKLLLYSIFVLVGLGGVSCRKQPTPTVRVTLEVWTTESDPATLQVMRDVGAQLTHADSAVQQVRVTAVPWSQLSQLLQQAYVAGRLPGVTHLEPFFTKFFVDRGLLLPLDSLVNTLNPADIEEAVRDEARFGGHYYGIPQHIGIGFMAYRADLLTAAGLQPPANWADMVSAGGRLTQPGNGRFGIYFPGGDQFFVDAIFFEALASNGGGIFTPEGKLQIDNPRVVEVLRYLRQIQRSVSPSDWQSATYVDGFPRMVRGQAALNLFVGGRATKTFRDQWADTSRGPAPRVFLPLEPPAGPSGTRGFTSLDAEPFVVINQAHSRGLQPPQQRAIEAASKRYLGLLYRRENYMRLVKSVPIQLMPIFKSMQDEYSRDPMVQEWRPWYDHAIKMVRENRVNPYYTTRRSDLGVPYLFELYGSKIISNMVLSAMSGEATPEQAAARAQQEAVARFESGAGR